jgi:hypothetical protein
MSNSPGIGQQRNEKEKGCGGVRRVVLLDNWSDGSLKGQMILVLSDGFRY